MKFHLVSNQSGKCYHNLNLVLFNKIHKRFLPSEYIYFLNNDFWAHIKYAIDSKIQSYNSFRLDGYVKLMIAGNKALLMTYSLIVIIGQSSMLP